MGQQLHREAELYHIFHIPLLRGTYRVSAYPRSHSLTRRICYPAPSQVLTLVLVICTSAIQLYLLTRAPFHLNFRHALQTTEGAGGAAAFVMSILVIWPVMALLLYHTRVSFSLSVKPRA